MMKITIMELIMKKLFTILACLLICVSLCSCKKEKNIVLEDIPISHEEEFGGIYIEITIDDFNASGFNFGDSINISFSNGYTLEDIPYYSGYYCPNGDPLLVGYPGYPYVRAGFNNGEDMWEISHHHDDDHDCLFEVASLSGNETATITLNKAEKYLDIQNARDIHYTDLRKDYPSDDVFANFRNIEVGNIKKGIIYRGASPCDNSNNRATYVNKLISDVGVKHILDLADNYDKIEGYIANPDFSCDYFLSLYKEGNVTPIALNMNFMCEDYAMKIVQGFYGMLESEGPYYVHCTEGKDRTGYVCMIIEALCGATYEEIINDYMITYDNYYKINTNNQKDKYDIIIDTNIDSMIEYLVSDDSVDFRSVDLYPYAYNYLLNAGMSENALNDFINMLTD